MSLSGRAKGSAPTGEANRSHAALGPPATMEIFAEFRFEAAHQLPHVPANHACARLHGHSYRIRVTASGTVDSHAGWVLDYGTMTAAIEPVRAGLDHRCLNDVDGLSNPTSENLAIWLWQRLKPEIDALCAIEVQEMPGFGCVYRG
jgi:6-pyruvoyltetrahydropterin/6-carboxytetrahydropterin synthase